MSAVLDTLRQWLVPARASDSPESALLNGAPPPSMARINEFLATHRFSDLLPYETYDPATGVFENDAPLAARAAGNDNKNQSQRNYGRSYGRSYGFALECLPLSGASESVAKVLGNLFNQTLPEGTGIQVMLWASPRILPRLAEWAARRLPDADIAQRSAAAGRPVRNESIHRRLARRRVEYLLKGAYTSLFRNQPYLVRDYKLTVSVTFPGSPDQQGLTKLLDIRDGMMSLLSTAHPAELG